MPYIGNIVQDFSVSTAMLNTDSVTSIKVLDGTIVNADINDSAAIAMSKLALSITNSEVNASAAIAGTKISPDFGSQNIATTGTLACGDITSSDGNGNLTLKDNNHTGSNCEHLINFTASDDTSLMNIGTPFGSNNLFFKYGSTELVSIGTSGQVDFAGNVDCNAGLDVTGSVAVSGSTDGVLNLDTSDSRGAFVRFGQGGSFHNMVGCADGLITGLDKEDLGIRATDKIGFSTNGDNIKMIILSGGNVGIGTSSPSTLLHCNLAAENGSIAQFGLSGQTNNQSFIIKADDSDSLFTFRFGSANSTYPAVRFNMGADEEALRIDSSGKVHIGLTNGAGQFNVKNQDDSTTNAFEVYNDNGVRNAAFSQSSTGDATMDLRTNTASQTVLLRSNGTSHFNGGNVGIGTTSPSNLLHLKGSGHDKVLVESTGTNHAVGIQITHASGNAAEQVWQLQTSGGASTQRDLSVRDATSGVLNTTFRKGGGITFNGDTAADNALDDYEEGTWTPTGSWTTIVARYTKIGRMVYAGFSLRADASSGNVTIGGFPFASDNNHAASGGIAWGLCEFNSTDGWLNGSIGDGESTATIRKNSAAVLTFGSGQNNLNNGAFIRGVFIYNTA